MLFMLGKEMVVLVMWTVRARKCRNW